MEHRKILPIWASLLLATVMGCARERPDNVLLIVVDTLRADHLSAYGYDRPTSPHLERWATKGLVFERALAPSPWTLPTFGSVLTGLWPAQHAAGKRIGSKLKRWRRAPLSPEVTTLPEVMQKNGFTTGAIVNNAFLREHFGAARGFEFYDYEKERPARAVVDLAREWLTEKGQERFFLMVHLIDPHLPYAPPAEFMGRFGDVPAQAIAPRGRRNVVGRLEELTEVDKSSLTARYDEEIASVDHELDRLFRHLEDHDLWSRTLVILTSDHGEELFDHGGFEHGHSMFQEVLRVPLIFWGPGIRAGRVDAPVSLVDLAPTIYEATGVAIESELAGVSLWAGLHATEIPEPRQILAHNTLWGAEHEAIVDWPFKLILNPKSGRRRLYDLAADPFERQNLAEENSATARELEQRLLDHLAGLEVNPTESGATLTQEVEDELRALGYLD